jgi:hypothetical protein
MEDMREFVFLRSDDMYYTFPAFAKAAVLKKKAQTIASEPSEARNEAGEAATQAAPENNSASERSEPVINRRQEQSL